jgi:putative acetyltransferase
MPITIRDYAAGDLDAVIEIFQRAIREVASRDYSPEQIAVWSKVDREEWADWRLTRPTFLALIDGEPAGFSDLEQDGHLDMMFVHPRFHRMGVATALVRRVEEEARRVGVSRVHAEVSITARPFFERQGFAVIREHPVEQGGLTFLTFRMEKDVREPD